MNPAVLYLSSQIDPYEATRQRIREVTASWADGMTLPDIRRSFERFLGDGVTPATLDHFQIGSMDATWISAHAAIPPRAMLYCHGGGFQIGSVRSHAELIGRLSAACDARILAFDYRLAPEHRFPAASDDAFAAYCWMLDKGIYPDAIAGDSAGGNLALTTAMRARDSGLPLPRGIVLLSPWLDLTMSGASYTALAAQDIFSKPEQLRAMARTYLGRSGDPLDPAASPVLGELKGLPPILVHTGACDITLDDAHLLEQKGYAQGVDVGLRVFAGMYHHFQVFGDLPEAAESISLIGDFVRELPRSD